MSWFNDITIDGRAAVLFLLSNDWRQKPKIAHLLGADEAEGGTGIEATASEHHAMRLTQTLYFYLEQAQAQELLTRLLALTDARIAIPLWADQRPADSYAADRIYAAQHYVNLDELTGAYVLDGSGGHPTTCGLLIGRLAAEPSIVAVTDQHATIELRIEDDSPWASRVSVNTLAAPTFDWLPDHRTPPRVQRHTQFERKKVGAGRETAFLRAEAPAKREDRGTFVLTGSQEIRRLLTFWNDKRGPHFAFNVPAWFHPGYEDGAEPVQHVRFIEEVLNFEFTGFDEIKVSIALREQLTLVGGQPDQARPSRAYLVKVWWDGSATIAAWAEWESPLTHGGLTYNTSIVEVSRSSETLRPGETEWELMVYDFTGNPLRAFALLARERRLKIEIRECDPLNAAGAVLVFTGEIKNAPRKGQIYRAKCTLFGDVLRHLVPNFYCQTSCNHTLYDDLCQVSEAAKKVTGGVTVVNATQLDVTGGAAAVADWFAWGYAAIGAGDTMELRFILRSAPIAGGQRLTVHRPLFYNGPGAAIDFYPGCDGQYAGGCAKHANQINYGGAPWKPDFIETVNTGFKAKTGK